MGLRRPLRLAQVIDQLTLGGAQKLLLTLAQAWPDRLTIISLAQAAHPPLLAELRRTGCPVITVAGGGLFDWARLARLVQLFRRERFDIVHTHLTYAHILGLSAAGLAGCPAVATLHTAGQDRRHYRLWRYRLETLALRHFSRRVVAVGQTVAEAHQPRLGRKRIQVIPNAVASIPPLAEAERQALRAHMVGDAARPVLISVGRLSLPKGYPDLLAAFSQLRQTRPAAALVIVGQGELAADLQAQVETLGLRGQAFLLGAREDVPRLLAASDMFVLASHWEGLPVAVLEAMAAGLPVVATAVGDVPQVLTPETGVLVPPHAPAELAAAVGQLLADPVRRRALGAAAQARVERDYGVAAWVERLQTLYSEISPTEA